MVIYIGNAHDPLAQPVEHLTFNQGVRSSNLRWVTKKALKTLSFQGFFAALKSVHHRIDYNQGV